MFVLIRFIQKFMPLESISILPRVVNGFLLTICSFEAELLKKINFPIGSSVIILATRK